MDARCGARTTSRIIGHARSWECEGAHLLAVIMTLLGEVGRSVAGGVVRFFVG